MPLRLHKFIANCGYSSRRHAELLIGAGRVKVNGRVVTVPGTTVDPEKDRVTINDEPVTLPEPLAIAFHKPTGIITSTHDTHERLTVMDYLPRSLRERGLVPAGRLDQDTEGLLVLTNLGDLNHRITHPRYETEKEYVATIEERPPRDALARLEEGVMLDGERTSPARITAIEERQDGTRVRIVIREGRKRQVRRMFAAVGHEVVHLRRERIGGLSLGDLPRGAWRELSGEEIERLITPGEEVLSFPPKKSERRSRKGKGKSKSNGKTNGKGKRKGKGKSKGKTKRKGEPRKGSRG